MTSHQFTALCLWIYVWIHKHRAQLFQMCICAGARISSVNERMIEAFFLSLMCKFFRFVLLSIQKYSKCSTNQEENKKILVQEFGIHPKRLKIIQKQKITFIMKRSSFESIFFSQSIYIFQLIDWSSHICTLSGGQFFCHF